MSDDCQIIEETAANKSISCTNIPEAFLDKNVAKKHFSQFGRIHSFTLRPKRYACTVEYETSDGAENALLDGYSYNGITFDIFFTPKETPKLRSDMDYIDPDVQSELEAMGVSRGQSNRNEIFKKIDTKPSSMFYDAKRLLRSKQSIEPLQPKPIVDQVAKNELEAIMKKPAFTSEEKFRVLDARDKLMRLTRSITKDINKVVSTQGVCPDMCPEKERLMREAKHQVGAYELEENSKNIMNHAFAIKQYSRSSADQESPLPHELRPEPILKLTMNYLLHKILDLCDMPDVNLSDWFHFLWDRTRSIRKDITQQELCSQTSVFLVEQCARIHIHCAARLIAEEPQVFDQKINTENLTKCLQSLKYMYHDLCLKNEKCPNEAEFRAYVVLLNLHDSNFLWEVKQLPPDILHSQELRFAIDVYLAMESNNYVNFFQLVRKTTYLNACILLRYFIQVRVRALNVLLKAYLPPRGPVTMTISYWSYVLAFEDIEQCTQFLEYYGLRCDRDNDRVILDRSLFSYPDLPFIMDRAINVVEHKRHCSVGETVYGGPLDSLDQFLKHEPHESFDENGYLTTEAWTVEDQNYLKPYTPRRKAPHIPFRTEENVFKIPLTPPSQLKSQQNPKPSIFTKLSPKAIIEPKKPSIPMDDSLSEDRMFTSLNQDKSSNLIFKKSIESSQNNIFNIPSTANLFGQSTFAKDAVDSTKNIFQLSKLTGSSTNVPSTLFTSKNIFATSTKHTFQNNVFGSSIPAQENVTTKSGIFASFNDVKPVSNTSSSVSSSIFGNYRDKSIKTQPNADFQTSGHVVASSIGNVNTSTPASIFGSFKPSSSRPSTLSGIVPLYSQNDPRTQAIMLKNEELKKSEMNALELNEMRQRQVEVDRKKEEELKREMNLEQAKLKKQSEIVTTTKVIVMELINECVLDELKCILNTEIEKYKRIKEQSQEYMSEFLTETILEEITRLLTNEIDNLNKNILSEYFWTWRINTRSIIERRQKIENTPLWMPEKSIPQHVPDLHHPLQEFTLNLKKRYRQGHAESIKFSPIKDNRIDIFKIVPKVLSKFSTIKQEQFRKNMVYWKCAISVPDPNEDKSFYRINKWINNSILRKTPSKPDIFFCEQQSVENVRQQFGICLRKLTGAKLINESGTTCKSDVAALNAILFFMSTLNLKQSKKRLKAILKNQNINDAIGIVIYNTGDVDQEKIKKELNLEKFMANRTDDCPPDYFYCDSSHRSLKDITENCIEFIASNYSFESMLEMQNTSSFLCQCLSDQFWNRITSSSKINFVLGTNVRNINVVINVYNDSLIRLIEICSHDVRSHPEFPDELRKFVPKNSFDIPLGYAYFPTDWKSTERQKKIKDFLTSLKLKQISLNLSNIESLQQSLLSYAKDHISSVRVAERAGYRMIEAVMKHLQNVDFELTFAQQIDKFSWIEPIKHITLEMLSFKFQASEQLLPTQIIYNKDELKYYTTMPWWLNKNGLLKNVKKATVDGDQSDERIIKKPKLLEIEKLNIDDILAKGAACLENADRKMCTFREVTSTSRMITKDLDESLYKQEQYFRVMKRVWDIEKRD